eukprot:scaffold3437_cov113-Cylindrotheca_fusiformis.AAC.2
MERLAMANSQGAGAVPRSSHAVQNETWRERVAKWYYDVLDHFNLPRDIAYVSMRILDRYVIAANTRNTMTCADFTKASISALFIAVRLSRPSALSLGKLMETSRSDVSVEDARLCVRTILKTLTWEHPILTPSMFVKAFLPMFQQVVSATKMIDLAEHVLYLVELSLCDRYFCDATPSQIALAALVLSIHPTTGPASCRLVDDTTFTVMLNGIRQKTGVDCLGSMEFKALCSHLHLIYGQSEEGNSSCHTTTNDEHPTKGNPTTTVAIIEDDSTPCMPAN